MRKEKSGGRKRYGGENLKNVVVMRMEVEREDKKKDKGTVKS